LLPDKPYILLKVLPLTLKAKHLLPIYFKELLLRQQKAEHTTGGLLSCRGDLHVLIVPSANQPHIGLTEYLSSKELNFIFN